MLKKILITIGFLSIFSCKSYDEDVMLHPQSNNQVVNTESVLKFKTKMEFDKTFESNVLDSKYKLLKNLQNSSYNYENIQGLRGLSKETIENLNLENLLL